MYTLYFAVVFVTLALSLPRHWEPTDCPQQCTCLMESNLKKVYCDIQDKQRLRTIPSRFPADSQYISLKGNRISTISSGAFSNLQDLRYLDLASNDLESLPPNIFQGLTSSLESLNLSRNRLGQLPSGLLNGLHNLRDLYLDGNVLENLPTDFFEGLTSLRRLYLDSNNFYTLSDKLFGLRGGMVKTKSAIISNLTSLVELLLNHNGIGQVQHDSFKKMSDLRRLKLNNNNITTLPRGIFRDLRSLRLLSIYKNPFQCTCSLKWLKDWIVQNQKYVTVFYQQLIRCEGPAKLRGRGLLDVKDHEFGCEDEWSEWSSWDGCSKTCDHGRQNRSRQCKSGACKGSDTESRWCNTHKCKPEWSPWSEWTPCSVTCSLGYQIRSHYTLCTQSPCQQLLETEERVCPSGADVRPCPSYTEWSSWSMCNPLCGEGKQVRQRECASSHFGVACPAPKVETRDCKIRDCAEWTNWGMWSACSKNCSKGEQTRKRDCVIVHGSKQHCSGNNTEKQECYIKPCSVDGGWSSWYPWTSCSKTCGTGFSTRNRQCSNPYPQHGGAKCNGSSFEVRECVRGLCNDKSVFTLWSEWSACSVQCGKGFKSRHRTCRKQHPTTGANMCLGNSEEYQNCEGKTCVGVWGEWTLWTKCIGNCNQGQTFRLRFCRGGHGSGDYVCENNKTFDVERQSCKPSTCSYEPVWSNWSAWSACSRSCARGTKRRRRYCVTKAMAIPCPGNQEDKAPCNIEPCPIHGGWSIWSEWGKCSEPCDGGIKQRNRTCTRPVPQYNGHQCIGNNNDKTICNTHRCRDDIQGDKHVQIKTEPSKNKPGVIKLNETAENCPTPKMPKNGKYTIKEQKDQHKFLEYKCNKYYRNRGPSNIRYCLDNGKWTGQSADCVPDCGEFKAPQKGDNKSRSIRSMTDFWPWQVAIEVLMKGIHCGGTLIGDQWVLTAAHCVLQERSFKYYEEIKVILGTHNLTDKSSREVQIIPVNKTEHHKNFAWKPKDGAKYSSDIAILKLKRKVHITKYVHPICLPKSKKRKRLIHAGNMGMFVGWGGTQESNLLRQIPLPVVRHQECQKSYEAYNYGVTEKMICAGYKDRADGICKKDSGGGFFFSDKSKSRRRKRWVLGGIASWRFHNCNKEEKYSVFTDVTKHMNWILERIGDW